MKYSYHHLSDLRHRFRELASITGGRDQKEYRNARIKMMQDMNSGIWIAEDQGKIIGSISFLLRDTPNGFNKDPDFVAAAVAKGVDPKTVQVRSLIYVHPDYRGQGIAHELELRANKTSRKLGFEYRAAFAYDTENIFNWIHRHGNAIDLEMMDPTGYPRSLIPLNSP